MGEGEWGTGELGVLELFFAGTGEDGGLRGEYEDLSRLSKSSRAAPITGSESMSEIKPAPPSSLIITASGWNPIDPSEFTVSACLTAILKTPMSSNDEVIPGS